MFAVVAGERHKLIKNLLLLTPRRAPIPRTNGSDQLFACCHAYLPCHVMLPPDHLAGNKLHEATEHQR